MDDFDDIPVIEDDSDDLETLDFSDDDLAEFSDDQDNPLDTGAEFSGQETTEVDGEEIILEIPDAEVNLDIFSSMSDDPDLQDVDELDETSTAVAETIEEYDNTAVIPTIGAVTAGERVMVVLKNGVPTAMGSTGFGDDINLRVHEIEADYIKAETIEAERVRVDNLLANKADISSLTAEQIRVDNLLAGKASVSDLTAATGRIDDLEADHVSVDDLEAANGKITNLETNALTANSAVIRDIQAETAKVENLTAESLSAATGYIAALKSASIEASDISADHATIAAIDSDYIKTSDLEAERATIDNLLAEKADISDLTAATGRIDDLEADHVSTDDLEAEQIRVNNLLAAKASVSDLSAEQIRVDNLLADKADISTLEAEYAHVTNGTIDNAKINHADVTGLNAEVADIADARISQATITQAQVQNLSADYAKITNGKINSALIDVAAIVDEQVFTVTGNKATIEEINADTITVRNLHTANLVVDSAEGYVTIGNKRTPTKEALDSLIGTLQQEIDGAVETFTSSAVPLLSNYPASDWQISGATAEEQRKAYAKHVGDICYVQNTASAQNGYAYRFAYDSTEQTFKWVLIKDSDVTKALGDISDLQTFESETNTWIEETDEGLRTIRENHTTLSGVVDKTMINSTQLWFSKANTTAPNKPTAEVTSTSTAGNAWRTVVPAYNASYPNYFYCYQWEYADGTFGWSAVTRDIAMGESQAQARKGVSDAASASNKATTAQNTANANIKSSVQLWFTKANNSAPTKPSSVISTNDAATGNAWNLAVPTYSSSYPHYFYCYQQQKGDGTYQWTDVVYDRATTENQAVARAALPSSTFETFRTTTFKEIVDTVDEQSTTITTLSEKTSTLANPNLTPWFSAQNSAYWNTGFSVDYDYATGHGHSSSTAGSKDVTYLNDGWTHVILDSRASAGNENKSSYINTWVNRNQLGDITPGGTYTWLIEVRNLSITKDTLRVRPSIGNATLDIFSAVPVNTTDSGCEFSEDGAKWIQVTAKSDLSNVTRDTRGYIYVITDVYAEADVRVSLYEGEYSGPYKPYVERLENITEISNTVNTVKQTADTNTASITNLTKTVSDNKTSIEQRASTIEQNLSGITTRVSSTETNIAKETRQRKGTYAECTTDAATVNKAATISPAVSDFELYPGVTVAVCFTTGNSVASPKLNVNNTGLYPIVVTGSATPALEAVKWSAWTTAMFTFDIRNQWRLVSVDEDVRRLTTAETKIEQNSEAISLRATKEEFNNLTIGGRNLVRDTEWNDIPNRWNVWGSPTTREIVAINGKRWLHLVTTTAMFQGYQQNPYRRGKANPANEIAPGDTLTVSCTAYATNAARWGLIGFHLNNASSIVYQEWISFDITTTPQRFSASFTIPDNTDIDQFNIMIGDNSTQAHEVWISEVKLEKGNRATDWTPAPEDMATNVALSAEVKIASDSITSTVRKTFARNNIDQFFFNTPFRTSASYDGEYWQSTSDNWLMRWATPLEEGWAHLSVSAGKQIELAIPRIESLKAGDQATLLFEWRNVTVEGNPNIYARNYPQNCQFSLNSYQCSWSTSTPTSGSKAVPMVCNSTATGTAAWNAAINLAMTNTTASGKSFEGDLRLSISTDVSRSDIISSINQSAETIKISADKVQINGTAVFSAIEDQLDAAYDAKGAAGTVQENLDNLQVGGRNLLLQTGSIFPRSGTSSAYFIEFTVNNELLKNAYELEEGVAYTFSANVTSSRDDFQISVGCGSGAFSKDIASKSGLSSGRVSLTFTPTAAQLASGKVFAFRAPRYGTQGTSFTYSIDNVKLEKGSKATDWTPAPEDIDASIATVEQGLGGFDILWNRAEFASDTNAGGECYLCAYDPTTATRSDANGWAMWNGTKRTITKGAFNPNKVLPYNIPIYIVCRLSSATATTGTNYMVWYDTSNSKWRSGPASPSTSTLADWTWAETTDMILGKFVEPGSEVAFTECETYRQPLKWGSITTDTVTARSANAIASSAQTTANNAAPKADAIARSQRIYYRATSASGKPAENKTWLAASGTGYGNWSLSIPQLKDGDTKYPFLYTAVQTQTVAQQAAGNTCSCTTVLIDETTTVIDGATIITGSVHSNSLDSDSVKANIVQTTDLSASKITSGDIATARMSANVVKAVQAKVSDLYALVAKIGGFVINATSIFSGTAVTSNADNSVALSTEDFTRTINSTSRAGLRFAIGDKFGVTGDGTLYANGANITSINASNISSGSISADRIKANVISAVNNGTGTINADKINVSAIKIGDLSGSIGGRNLLRDEDVYCYNAAQNQYLDKSTYSISGTVLYNRTAVQNEGFYITNTSRQEIGESYVVHFDITDTQKVISTIYIFTDGNKLGTTGANVSVYIDNIKAGAGNVALACDLTGGTTKHVDIYFEATTAPTSTYKGFILQANKSTANAFKAIVTNLKWEKGSKPTDWSPAPEDQTAYVDNSVNSIQIGGTNLLRDSTFTAALGTYWVVDGLTASVSESTLIINGASASGSKRIYHGLAYFKHEARITYTVSCDIVSTAACKISFGRRYSTVDEGGVTFDVTTTKKRVSGSYQTIAGAFCIGQPTNNATVTISNIKLEIGNKATDWSPAPEDISQMVKINTAVRNFTTAQWKSFGAVGHEENWTTGSSYSNGHIHAGDTAYITGTVSDGVGGTATIIGTVIQVNGTNGVNGIRMSSTQLIFGGDSVDAASKTATTYLTDITGGGVKVHPSGSDTTGVWITDDVDIVRDGTSVAMFGTDGSGNAVSRVGLADSGHTEQKSSSFDIYVKDEDTQDLLKAVSIHSSTSSGTLNTLEFYSEQDNSISIDAEDFPDDDVLGPQLYIGTYCDTPNRITGVTLQAAAMAGSQYKSASIAVQVLQDGTRKIDFSADDVWFNDNVIEGSAIASLPASKLTGTIADTNLPTIPSAGTAGTSSATSGATLAVPYVTTDAYGRVTAKGTHTHTIGSLEASAVTSGTFDAARIPSLNASKITAGTFNAARIPNLNASKINAGTFDSARLPTISIDKGGTGDTDVETVTAQATIFTSVTSGMTISSLTCATWGKMCMLSFTVKPSAAQSAAFTIGTLATAYRPVAVCTANPYHSSVATARILTNGTIQMTAAPANEIPVSFTYLLA